MGGDHIISLSITTHQNKMGKDMEQRPVVENQFFRDRTRSTCPLPVLGAWLDELSPAELQQGYEKMQKAAGKGHPPTAQSTSVMIKALNDIDSKGQTVWWEAIELWVVGKGVTPYPLPTHNMDQCMLVPSIN